MKSTSTSVPHIVALVVGTGMLTWVKNERATDRYGYVYLQDTPGGRPVPLRVPPQLRGKPCRMTAVVLETRESDHVGDTFHGVYPVTPAKDEVIVLGEGRVSVTADGVGLMPNDGRKKLWLDIRALYRAHHQTVELRLEPIGGAK